MRVIPIVVKHLVLHHRFEFRKSIVDHHISIDFLIHVLMGKEIKARNLSLESEGAQSFPLALCENFIFLPIHRMHPRFSYFES